MKSLIKLVNTPIELEDTTVKRIRIIGVVIILVIAFVFCAYGNVNGLSNTYLG